MFKSALLRTLLISSFFVGPLLMGSLEAPLLQDIANKGRAIGRGVEKVGRGIGRELDPRGSPSRGDSGKSKYPSKRGPRAQFTRSAVPGQVRTIGGTSGGVLRGPIAGKQGGTRVVTSIGQRGDQSALLGGRTSFGGVGGTSIGSKGVVGQTGSIQLK